LGDGVRAATRGLAFSLSRAFIKQARRRRKGIRRPARFVGPNFAG
jgi:hypothetical protein